MSAKRRLCSQVPASLVGALLCAWGVLSLLPACAGPRAAEEDVPPGNAPATVAGAADETPRQARASFGESRAEMIEELRRQGIESEAVLAAVGRVPRERFVSADQQRFAYGNHPLPIGHGQTISQPYIVALMTELLQLEPGDRVLEIGTGSGYQAAVLTELDTDVYTIEIIPPLADTASTTLTELGYGRVNVRQGDGYLGWPEEAPFDKVIVTAAPEQVPAALVEQLRPGGRMVVPVGPQGAVQQLMLLEKSSDGEVRTRTVIPVAFVPMVR